MKFTAKFLLLMMSVSMFSGVQAMRAVRKVCSAAAGIFASYVDPRELDARHELLLGVGEDKAPGVVHAKLIFDINVAGIGSVRLADVLEDSKKGKQVKISPMQCVQLFDILYSHPWPLKEIMFTGGIQVAPEIEAIIKAKCKQPRGSDTHLAYSDLPGM